MAGAISAELNIGDVVIAQRLFQHDMDARPLMRRFEIPLTGKTSFEIPDENTRQMADAVHHFLLNNREFRKRLAENDIKNPKMMLGDIASGDLFVSGTEMKNELIRNLPSVVCVEMEGAAIAHVAEINGIAFVVIRSISDHANENTEVDYNVFEALAANQSASLVLQMLEKM